MSAAAPADAGAARRARWLIALAAVLWSLSALFTRFLAAETPLGLHEPRLTTLHIAFFRALFAGLVMLPLLRRSDVSFRPLMAVMVASFAAMNVLFVTALALAPSGTAILLQYTAPFWLTLAGVWLLGEPLDRRNFVAILIGSAGVGVIIAGHGFGDEAAVTAMALGSGVTYAAVLLCLRLLRDAAPAWLTLLNHLGSALVLLPWVVRLPSPTLAQLAFLALFGAVQMGLPYLLMARGLRHVSPQQAGTLTLLEPVLNPLWPLIFLGQGMSGWTLAGGAFILGALLWRYAPLPRARGEKAGAVAGE